MSDRPNKPKGKRRKFATEEERKEALKERQKKRRRPKKKSIRIFVSATVERWVQLKERATFSSDHLFADHLLDM